MAPATTAITDDVLGSVCGQSCGASIPLSALLVGTDGTVAQSVHDDRNATRHVTAGPTGESSVEIREAIAEGDIIVMRAGAFLRQGDRIRPMLDGACCSRVNEPEKEPDKANRKFAAERAGLGLDGGSARSAGRGVRLGLGLPREGPGWTNPAVYQ
jgi:hypothetical protein